MVNRSINRRYQTFAALALTLVLGCEAERDNPRDPLSPYYDYGGTIVGWVKTRIGEPIAGVRITIEPEHEYSFTDKDGFYELKQVVEVSCTLIAHLDGYASDSTSIELEWGGKDTVNFILDSLPGFHLCRVTTHVESKIDTGSTARYALFEAEVFDGDDLLDIQSVLGWIGDPSDTFNLEYDPGNTANQGLVYRKAVSYKNLPGGSLEGLLGKDCIFLVRDRANKETVSNPVRAVRVIVEIVELIKPVNHARVNKNPELIWHKADASFPYTYTVEVEDADSLIWSRAGIPCTDTIVQTNLDQGEYSWHVWIADEFGDRSRSVGTGFIVQ
ncbi:carboxypeptidase regulatory-like domain-containing protein [candidate division WOR-3 bacterium]|nr:carboxypeptidase regulatory-like domain-containing protein [candidate division WOR-3 bacterium]